MDKKDFLNRLNSLKKLYEKAQDAEHKFFDDLFKAFPGVEFALIPTDAENADNVIEAMCCHYFYGEYDQESIWDEIEGAVKEF